MWHSSRPPLRRRQLEECEPLLATRQVPFIGDRRTAVGNIPLLPRSNNRTEERTKACLGPLAHSFPPRDRRALRQKYDGSSMQMQKARRLVTPCFDRELQRSRKKMAHSAHLSLPRRRGNLGTEPAFSPSCHFSPYSNSTILPCWSFGPFRESPLPEERQILGPQTCRSRSYSHHKQQRVSVSAFPESRCVLLSHSSKYEHHAPTAPFACACVCVCVCVSRI